MEIVSKRKPIPKVIENPSTPPEVRAQLETVGAIRRFAVVQLDLPDNGSYRSYADLGRPYVVWNVVAAPEFSIEPREWCYPIVGCVAYRGYFKERKAQAFAAKLRRRGLDVSVTGVAAYSTLGHFDDPVLNTMIGWSDVELASIMFHELTHQMLYVPDDADFNEAFATTVEQEGVRRWLAAQDRTRDLAAYERSEQRYQQVVDLLIHARAELGEVYASGASRDAMLTEKRARFDGLRQSYDALKAGWDGFAPFGAWFDGELNNAQLASVATYYDCVPGFKRELAAAGGDLPAFYRRAHELARLPQKQRDALMCGQGR